mmetsp:Transcript_57293/g.158560  ORF Transcript_57293/g.158560 Transcript_57293/m.158560 type:complete len:129 (+) Transcript_57293:3-389(+)
MKYVEGKLTQGNGNIRVAFVVTAGGSMGSNSKDVEETKHGLSGATNNGEVFFAEGTDPVTDFALLIRMDALVLSSSSFGWWAGFVSEAGKADGLVVAPQYLYKPGTDLAKGFREADYFPPNWKLVNNL